MSRSSSHVLRMRMIAACLLVMVLPCAGAAEDMVPAEVVLELLEVAPRYGFDDASLVFGAVPADLSELLALPDDLEILVSLVWKDGTSIIGRSDLSRAQLGGALEVGLVGRGWSRYQRQASGGGFQPSSEDSAAVYCLDRGDALMVDMDPRGEDETGVRLKYQASTGFSNCNRDMAREEQIGRFFGENIPFPTLYPPDGSKSQGSAGGSAGDYNRSAKTHLETDLAPAEVLVHYASQLGQQGWQPDARIVYDSLAYQSWLFLDESGKEWHGLLRVVTEPHDDSKRAVRLEVTYLGQGWFHARPASRSPLEEL